MELASWILFAMGVLGALDILLFHMLGQNLRGRVESRAELVTHFLRGPAYFALFLWVPNSAPSGAAAWLLLAPLAVDFAISVADFSLEPSSRRSAGGLPPGEYLLHVLLAMLFGALVLTVVQQVGPRLFVATDWGFGHSDAPLLLRVVLAAMAPIALVSAVLDLMAVRRLGKSVRTDPVRTPRATVG